MKDAVVSRPALSIVKTVSLDDPYITAGDRAYLIGAQNGGFPDLGWHVPGEMGGLWAHPIKLLDGIWLCVDGVWLSGAQRYTAGPFWSAHGYSLPDGLRITRWQAVPDGEAALVMSYTISTPIDRTLRLRMLARTDLQGGWLAHQAGFYDGYDHAAYDETLGAWVCRDDCHPWYAVVGLRGQHPHGYESGRELWGPERTAGRGISVALDVTLDVRAGAEALLDVVVAGSDRGADAAIQTYRRVCACRPALWRAKEARFAALLGRSRLDVPEPAIVRAWDWLKCDNDWLVRDVPGLGRGLGAGVQDYPWWFGCDSAYAVRGCLALGQHEIAIQTLDLIRDLSVAWNGESGRVIHEATTGGVVFNPGNAQETPHHVRAVRDVFRWTGDLDFLRRHYAFCRRGLLEWTLGTCCHDGDVLPHGYGIIEVADLNLQCIDTAALTAEALDALAGMAALLGDGAIAERCRELYQRVRDRIDAAFWIEEEGLYADMLATPAEMAPRLRGWIEAAEQRNAARMEEIIAYYRRLLAAAEADPYKDRKRPWLLKNWIVLAPLEGGLAAPERAVRVLERVESPEFTGRWGMYLSGVAQGAMMSINTGVLAACEALYGRPDRALGYVRLLAETLDLFMPGAIAEMSPDDGCFVQAWSSYAVAWPLVSGIFGMQPDAFRRRLVLAPAFPPGWSDARLNGVRIGGNTVDLAWDGETLTVTSREPGWTISCEGVPCRVIEDTGTGV